MLPLFIILFIILFILLFSKNHYKIYTFDEHFAPYKSNYVDVHFPEMAWNNQTRFTKYMSYDLRGGIPPSYLYYGPWNMSSAI